MSRGGSGGVCRKEVLEMSDMVGYPHGKISQNGLWNLLKVSRVEFVDF